MKRFAFLIFSILLSQSSLAASGSKTIVDAISNGESNLSFRYRFENVDQDSFLKNANASSIKTRFNYKTKSYKGLNVYFEFDNVSYTGNEMFDNTRNGENTYPVVADPNGSDLNQLYFGYNAKDLAIKFGRQRINFDNQRFVGGVGWRQNEQTYDALSASYTGVSDLKISYAYVTKVLSVFGPEDGNPPRYLDSRSHLINANYHIEGAGDITVYIYDLDFEDDPAASNRTMGARYTNKFETGELTIPVAFEIAKQKQTGDNPNKYSADYLLLEGGINFSNFTAMLGIESLGGDITGGSGFITPTATGHKFQGWADQLSGRDEGIVDTYLSFSGDFSGHKVSLTHHSFETEESLVGFGTVDYGSEVDISYATKLTENLAVLFKYAQYKDDVGVPADDVNKMWLVLTATF